MKATEVTKEWLERRYVRDLAPKREMASELGCSVANIDRLLAKHGVRRGTAAMIGRPAWNSGLTKDEDPRLKQLSEDRMGSGNPMFGRKAWNSGVGAEDDERVAKTVKAMHDGYRDSLNSGGAREKLRRAKLGKRGKDACNYKRGHYVNFAGYAVESDGERKIYQHRRVAEEMLGRLLSPDDAVHHFDGDKLNNAPVNLLVTTNSGHKRLHANCFPASREDQINWLIVNAIPFETLA
jgi:hypothetical protein